MYTSFLFFVITEKLMSVVILTLCISSSDLESKLRNESTTTGKLSILSKEQLILIHLDTSTKEYCELTLVSFFLSEEFTTTAVFVGITLKKIDRRLFPKGQKRNNCFDICHLSLGLLAP